MNRILILCCTLLSITLSSTAQLPLNQQRYADSLITLLQKEKNDSIKAKLCFHLMYYWQVRDTAKAKHYLEQGRIFSKNNLFLQGLSYAHEGYYYFNSDLDKSEIAYLKADSILSHFDTKEAYVARTNILQNYGVIFQARDDDRTFTDIILNRAIPMAEKAKDSAVLGSQYVSVSVGFMNIEQYDKAEIYLNNAINIMKLSHAQSSRLVAAYNRAGENYIYLKKINAAKGVLDTVKEILAPYPESELYAGYYQVEGMYLHELKKYNEAITSFDKGIKAANGPNKAYRIQELQFLKVKSLLAAGKYEPARQILLSLAADEDVISLDAGRAELYSSFAEAYAGLGNTKLAYEWNKRYSQLNDSMNDSRLKRDINALEIRYKNAEKEREIISLKAKNEQSILKARNNQLVAWLFAVLSIFLLIVAALAWVYYRNNRKLSVQKDINHQQQIREMEQQQQLTATTAMLAGEERERQRLARDLHDGLGGMLAGIKMDISRISEMELPVKERLPVAVGQLDDAIGELRRIARNMMPETLFRFGLPAALKDFCESFEKGPSNIILQCYGMDNNDLSPSVQVMVYRIIQELVTNALKHAKATDILIDCIQNDNQVDITVEDNGKGFDPDRIKNGGIGLSNIQTRVNYLNGKLDIQSSPGTGTTVTINIFLNEQ